MAVAEAARRQHGLHRVTLMQSRSPLGKESVERPIFRHRAEVLAAVAAEHEWLDAGVTDHRLLADIAEGYDVLIMGADKWHQIQELRWYDDSETERDAALARLPTLAVAPRPPLSVPPEVLLDVEPAATDGVSSTEARAGRVELMAPSARAFAERTGAWIDADRYERHLAEAPEM